MKPQLTRSAPIPWPAEVDRNHVRQATSRLLAHVSGQVASDGAIRGLCDSRVLESALALSLMTRIAMVCPERDRLLGYLQVQQHAPQRLDRVLATLAVRRATGRAAAGDSELVGKLTHGVLGAAPGFISTRRRKMVSAVLSVLGCPLPADVAPAADEQSPVDPLHSWGAVQQAAVALILATAAGVSNQATADALRTLLATDPAHTVWEGYVLMHLLTLHALAGVPGQEATVRKGVRTVLAHQRGDGGFPFVAEMHNWCTSTGGIAMAAAGAPSGLLRRMAGMLVTHQGGAAHAALARGATLTGGWSMSPRVAQNDVDDTSCALEFLQAIDPVAYGSAVRRGVDALLAVQGKDGGFPTYVAGASSEPCMTAAAVCALAPHASTLAARDRALGFLADSQLADGGWEPGWSSSRLHTLFRARLAAATAGPHDVRTAMVAERIERTVRETQNDDGGWGMQPGDPSDDISTAYGVITLTCGTHEQPIGRALAWLLEHQDPGGGFSGPPDMVGPRPFPYKFPILTGIPVLLAFGHVRSRVTGTAAVREVAVR